MRKAKVFFNTLFAGTLEEQPDGYRFSYDEAYRKALNTRPISLHFPKSQRHFESKTLFPFFFNMLSEGFNKHLQSNRLKIDENDHFGLLLATAQFDTIGAVSLQPIDES